MQLTVDVKTLQAGITTVIKSLSVKPSMPVLEGIYLKATEEGLLLRCSDLTLQIDSIIEANVEKIGEIVLPGKLFADICYKLAGDRLELSVENSVAKIVCGRSKTNMQCINANDYPDISSNSDAAGISIPQNILKNMIRQTVFACAQDDTKRILTGVLCEINDGEFNMVALDGFRLALRKERINDNNKIELVVPARSLIEISKTLGNNEDKVELHFTNTHVSVDIGYTKIISRLLDGDFIKYSTILPTEHGTRVLINKDELLDSIDRAMLMAREGSNNLVRFTIEDKKLIVFSNSTMGRFEEDIEISLNGEPIQIAFNAKYFADALKVLSDEELYLDMNNNVSPCVVRPIQGDSFYYLILPVRVFT